MTTSVPPRYDDASACDRVPGVTSVRGQFFGEDDHGPLIPSVSRHTKPNCTA